jgi:hypothetical protein
MLKAIAPELALSVHACHTDKAKSWEFRDGWARAGFWICVSSLAVSGLGG